MRNVPTSAVDLAGTAVLFQRYRLQKVQTDRLVACTQKQLISSYGMWSKFLPFVEGIFGLNKFTGLVHLKKFLRHLALSNHLLIGFFNILIRFVDGVSKVIKPLLQCWINFLKFSETKRSFLFPTAKLNYFMIFFVLD